MLYILLQCIVNILIYEHMLTCELALKQGWTTTVPQSKYDALFIFMKFYWNCHLSTH